MKRTREVTLKEAERAILTFFKGDFELTEAFMEIAADMLDAVPDTCVRYSDSIIGVAHRGGRYRFYIVPGEGRWIIKYKHQQAGETFTEKKKAEYLRYNTECNTYLAEHLEVLAYTDERALKRKAREERRLEKTGNDVDPIYNRERVSRDEVKCQWAPVHELADRAIDIEKARVSDAVLSSYCWDITELIKRFVKSALPDRSRDVVLFRILSENAVTLQEIGDNYGVSREYIRQLEIKVWRTVTNGFIRGTKAVFAEWRKELCGILLKIDASHFIQTMAYALKENARVGEFLIKATAPIERAAEYRLTVEKSGFEKSFEAQKGQLIPEEIIAQVQELEILPYIESRRDIVYDGDRHRGTCFNCSCDSLIVNPKSNYYYCFSCKSGGGIIDYVKGRDGLGFREAVLKLAKEYRIGETNVFLEKSVVMSEAARYYHEQLKTNENKREAIDTIHSWGIYGKDVVRLCLGFNDNTFRGAMRYLSKTKGIDPEMLLRYGIIGRSENGNYYDRWRNAIVIPTVSPSGNVVCFDYFSLTSKTFKKDTASDTFKRNENLYSLNLAVNSGKKSVVVVSDYPSYFALVSRGVYNVVSSYSSEITKKQIALLGGHFKAVIIAFKREPPHNDCTKACRKNRLFYDRLQIDGIAENIDKIKEKIDFYESAFN